MRTQGNSSWLLRLRIILARLTRPLPFLSVSDEPSMLTEFNCCHLIIQREGRTLQIEVG